MRAALGLAICSVIVTTGPAFAQATSSTGLSADISSPASIEVTQNLNFTISPQSLSTGLTITSSAVNGVNTNILLGGAAGTAVSIAVPATFDVVNTASGTVINVRTIAAVPALNATAGVTPVAGFATSTLLNAPIQVVGGQFDNGILSFSVGAAVTATANLVPGQYSGVLQVIAQYN